MLLASSNKNIQLINLSDNFLDQDGARSFAAFLSENNLEHFAPSVEAFNAYFKKTPKYFGLDKKGNLSFYYSFTE